MNVKYAGFKQTEMEMENILKTKYTMRKAWG